MNNMEQQRVYQNLAESLANLFSPTAEVALYDRHDQVIGVFNRLTRENITKIEPASLPIKLTINKTQPVKAMVIPLEDGYYLRLLVDLELFLSLQAFLQRYVLTTVENEKKSAGWQQIVDSIIDGYLDQHKTTLTALSYREKRVLILLIHGENLFRYQDATKYLASKLGVSRATIYNYLKQASSFKSLEVHQVDSFTDEAFSGNPAGVVLEADKLSDVMMKKIAREMNLSQTSFLLTSKMADIRLRYFTPTGSEIRFCGHSTVGALYMLAHKKMLGIDKPGRYALTLEAHIGVIHAAITLTPDEGIIIEFQTPKVELVDSHITHQEVAQALGIPFEAINLKKPVMYEKNNQDLFVTISSLKQLSELEVDQRSAKQFADTHQIVAYALICRQTVAKESHIHMRCFAPAVGIPEDPFTGSVLGGLAVYITKNKLIDRERIKTVRVEQGHFISRPGYVDLKLSQSAETDAPLVIAKARHFFSTEIKL